MIQQRTPEWFAKRCGRVTASRVADVISKTKSGYGASRANYMAQLLTERITGQPVETYRSKAMDYGIEMEAHARLAYEIEKIEAVQEIDFVPHPEIEYSGASPDGLVNGNGLLEIKCPNSSTHINTLLSQEVPTQYIPQMQWQMACTGREYCDFVSFDARCPDGLKLFIKKVERDDEYIKMLETEVRLFLLELNDQISILRSKYEHL